MKSRKYLWYMQEIMINNNFRYEDIHDAYGREGITADSIRKAHRDSNRGNLPIGIRPSDFYDSVVLEYCQNDDGIKNYAHQLYTALDEDGIIPDDWKERKDEIDGNSDNFDQEEFRRFIIKLLSLDKQKPKRNKQKQKQKAVIKKTSPYKSFSCFDQTVSKAEDDEEIIKISDDDEKSDFSKQSEFSRIMIEGTGGQGKSTFLYRLQQKMISTGKYEYVIIIELTELLSLKDDELSHDRLSEDSLFRHFIAYINKTEQNADKIIRSMLSDDTTGKSKPVLLLLDGLNELFASPDMKNVTAVVKELGYITDKWNHVSIIATTRPSEDRFSYK
ncbi:MAG: NACHT domain-containing protein, partial [Monoglobaceae bacterium]